MSNESTNPRDERETERPRMSIGPTIAYQSVDDMNAMRNPMIVSGTQVAPNPRLLDQMVASADIPEGYELDTQALELGLLRVVRAGRAPQALEVVNDQSLHERALAERMAKEAATDLLRKSTLAKVDALYAGGHQPSPAEVAKVAETDLIHLYQAEEAIRSEAAEEDMKEAFARGQAAMLKSVDELTLYELVKARSKRTWDRLRNRIRWGVRDARMRIEHDEHEDLFK